MKQLHLKIPPPIYFLLTGGLIYFTNQYLPLSEIQFLQTSLMKLALTFLLVIAAFLVAGSAVITFLSNKTTVNPHHPQRTSALITSGIYHYSRNPMYLSLLLLLTAWWVYLGTGISFVWLPIFVLCIDEFQIKPEEHHLHNRFGNAYQEYCKNVRRWL